MPITPLTTKQATEELIKTCAELTTLQGYESGNVNTGTIKFEKTRIGQLIQSGADVNAIIPTTNSEGTRALHVLAHIGATDLFTKIKNKTPDIDFNISDNLGNTPLHYALTSDYNTHPNREKGHLNDFVTYLKENGADANLNNGYGRTPAADFIKHTALKHDKLVTNSATQFGAEYIEHTQNGGNLSETQFLEQRLETLGHLNKEQGAYKVIKDQSLPLEHLKKEKSTLDILKENIGEGINSLRKYLDLANTTGTPATSTFAGIVNKDHIRVG